jgi:hypothetical protein
VQDTPAGTYASIHFRVCNMGALPDRTLTAFIEILSDVLKNPSALR